MILFLAGATGAIGTPLVALALAAGHDVYGMTRNHARAAALDALGARGIVADAFDAAAVAQIVGSVRPDAIVHQLTDLAGIAEPGEAEAALARNARLRINGTRNLMAAARAAGVPRAIAQSILWTYAPGPEPHGEDDPLEANAAGSRGVTVRAVIALERSVTQTAGVRGVVLRYGRLYGPGTGASAPPAIAPVHVDAAAYAALLALDRGEPGTYNVAEDNAYAATDKARRALGWDPGFRRDD